MREPYNITTDSYLETQNIAEKIAKSLRGGEVICLYGDLGFGKTTFIQGLAKGLGIKGRIISPTFIIMRSYKISLNNNLSNLQFFYHVDLYRINHEQEIIDIGLSDILGKPENVVTIEWPEKMKNLLPEKRINIQLDYLNENKRKITISSKI